MNKGKEWGYLTIGFLGTMLGVYGVASFNQFVLASLPLGIRMAAAIASYWLIGLVPLVLLIISRDKWTDYGFTKEKVGFQIIIGILLGAALSLLFTLIPHLAGLGEFVDNGHRYQYGWQFAYEFCYCIISVGCVEEFVFRGFVYEKIKKISRKESIAVVGSSILFGVFHFLSGSILQMAMTALIGVLFCLFRIKIKNCSVLSLMIAHGIYDAMITVWDSFFFRT